MRLQRARDGGILAEKHSGKWIAEGMVNGRLAQVSGPQACVKGRECFCIFVKADLSGSIKVVPQELTALSFFIRTGLFLFIYHFGAIHSGDYLRNICFKKGD